MHCPQIFHPCPTEVHCPQKSIPNHPSTFTVPVFAPVLVDAGAPVSRANLIEVDGVSARVLSDEQKDTLKAELLPHCTSKSHGLVRFDSVYVLPAPARDG